MRSAPIVTGGTVPEETPFVPRRYCPGCEPELDPTVTAVTVYWCTSHEPTQVGEMDRFVRQDQYLTGSGEAEGLDNRKWCDFFHRGITS